MGFSSQRTALVLGTYHMANPGQDMENIQADDVLAAKRQQEMRELVEGLKAFHPTKIAFEHLLKQDEEINQDYRSFQEGKLNLGSNEAHQIGFRLASELGHTRVYPVDWNQSIGGPDLKDIADYAEAHMPEVYDYMSNVPKEKVKKLQEQLDALTLKEVHLTINDPATRLGFHEMNMSLARVGYAENYIGVEWVANYWYRRNLIIFSNIARISSPGDRILVIYGLSHAHLLSQLMSESGLFHVESVHHYLAN